MRLPQRKLQERLDRLREKAAALARAQTPAVPATAFARYYDDPVGYFRDVLKADPTPDQCSVLRSLRQPPYRTLVKSGHNIGKTYLAAGAVNWWYDTRDPSVAITTAPTERDVIDLLWTEVRLQRRHAGLPGDFIGPVAPEMRSGQEHYAKGYTASKGESFQGRHRRRQLFVFDESEGVPGDYWKTVRTMFQPTGDDAFLAICNPTTTTSQRYQEEKKTGLDGERQYRVFSISSLDHPNIAAQLAGRPPVIPSAVTLAQVNDWLGDMFEPVPPGEHNPETDVEFPPGSGVWLRPGPDGEARVLGRNPSGGSFGVWSERLWQMAASCVPLLPGPHDLPEIGGDVARFGNDRTELHVRVGPCSYHHEDHSGWDTVRTANRLMDLAEEWLAWANDRRDPSAEPLTLKAIKIKVDDTGVGGGVTDILRAAKRFNVVAVNAGESASTKEFYPRVRDELWFTVAARARAARLDLTRLGAKRLAQLEVQALAPTWTPTPDRKRRVESKEETKKRLPRSPDGIDAMNLAYYEPAAAFGAPAWIDTGRADGGRTRRDRR